MSGDSEGDPLQRQGVVQILGEDASDAHLSSFVFPEAGEVVPRLRIIEAGERLIVAPRPIPMIFVAVWMLLTVGAITLLQVRVEGMNEFIMLGLVMAAVAAATVIGVLYLINRGMLSKGDYIRADGAGRLIELPRLGMTLAREQILELVQVDGWTTDLSENWHRYELTVLARGSDGLRRYPLVVGAKRDIVRLAERLSALMGCRLRRIHIQ